MKIKYHKVCQLAPFYLEIYLVYQFHRNHVSLLIFPHCNFKTIVNPYLGEPKDLASELHSGRFEIPNALFIFSINASIKGLMKVL